MYDEHSPSWQGRLPDVPHHRLPTILWAAIVGALLGFCSSTIFSYWDYEGDVHDKEYFLFIEIVTLGALVTGVIVGKVGTRFELVGFLSGICVTAIVALVLTRLDPWVVVIMMIVCPLNAANGALIGFIVRRRKAGH
jgi:hypothetical protein